MKKLFLCAAAAVLALVGCEKQEQSSLNFEDVKLEAKVSGTLVYFADKAGAQTQEVALAKQRVYFQIAANEYADNAKGNQTFEAVTDTAGAFVITVPMGMKSITGDLLTDVIVIGEGSDRIVLDETKKTITLNAGDNKIEKRIAKIDQVLTACQGVSTVQGKVTFDAGYVKRADGAVEKNDKAIAPADLKVRIAVEYADETRTLIAKTDANGAYKLDVPVPADGKDLDAHVSIEQFQADFGKKDSKDNVEILKGEWFAQDGAAKDIKVKDGEQKFVEDIAAKRISKDGDAQRNVAFKVFGQIEYQVEGFKMSDVEDQEKLIVSSQWEYEPYTGPAVLTIKHDNGVDPAIELEYDINAKDANYSQEVAIYENWKLSDVTIEVKVKKYAVTNYVHYYQTAKYDKKKKWEEFPGVWNTIDGKGKVEADYTGYDDDIRGTYEGSTTGTYDGFFDVSMPKLQLKFSINEEDKKYLKGYGNKDAEGNDIDYDSDKHQIYGHDGVIKY